jgi:hypothetical protein
MRLVHYYPRALVGDGGPTRAMWEWASATYAAGCEVAILYDAELEAQSSLRNPAIPLVPLQHSGTGRIRVPRRLAANLTTNDVLVLHSTYVPSNISAAWSARRHGIPYVVVPHGGYNKRARERRHRRGRLIESRVLGSVNDPALFNLGELARTHALAAPAPPHEGRNPGRGPRNATPAVHRELS